MEKVTLHPVDLLVVLGALGFFIAIGTYFAKKTTTSEGYFFGGRKMSGWVVGFSMMATVISSMTFLATPGFTYQENWRYLPANFGYFLALPFMIFLFMPFFRRTFVKSAYEFLEKRFGLWARMYAAGQFIVFQIIRMGVILYAVSLAVQEMTEFPLHWVVVVLGIAIAVYTISGGIEAVIWTDLFQGCALIIGGFICLPIIIAQLPGGFEQFFTIAAEHDKMSLGSTALSFREKTIWVMILMSAFNFLQIGCTDQMMVQRYCAPKNRKHARNSVILGAVLTVPLWLYFSFIGTAIFVFYKVFPDPALQSVQQPEQILPFFILREVPPGLAGFVLTGLLTAAMSTLDSSINAAAVTVTSDFYRRFQVNNEDERHYLKAGRWFSVAFGAIMIFTALAIHWTRTQTLQDIQALLQSITSGGLAGLFLLGLLTTRTDSRSALIGIVVTTLIAAVWLLIPPISDMMPHKFWMVVLLNIFMLVFGYLVCRLIGKMPKKELNDLTIWTVSDERKE
jgi:SSS family solute:Na+ symporter